MRKFLIVGLLFLAGCDARNVKPVEEQKTCPIDTGLQQDVCNKICPIFTSLSQMNYGIKPMLKSKLPAEQEKIDCIRDWAKSTKMDKCVREQYDLFLGIYQQMVDELSAGKMNSASRSTADDDQIKAADRERTNPIPAPPKTCPIVKKG